MNSYFTPTTRMLFFFIFTLVLFLSATTRVQNGILFQQGGTLETLMERIINEKSFAFVHTTWKGCTPCSVLEQKLYPNSTVGNLYNNSFINYQLDVDRVEYFNMSNILNLGKNATLLYISPDGQLVKKAENVSTADDLIANAEEVTHVQEKTPANQQKLQALNRKVSQGYASPNELLECAYLLKTYNQPCSAVVNQYLSTQTSYDMELPVNRKFVYDFLDNVETKTIDYLLENISYYKITYGTSFNEKITIAIYNSLRVSIQQRDDKLFNKILYTLDNASLPFIDDLNYFIKAQYYEGTKNFDKFADITIRYIAKSGMDNTQLLVASAEKFFLYMNEKKFYEKALSWANTAISIEGPNYRNQLITARLLRKLGNTEKALEVAKQAEEEAKQNNIDTKEIQDLQFALEDDLKP